MYDTMTYLMDNDLNWMAMDKAMYKRMKYNVSNIDYSSISSGTSKLAITK